jgi:hypothetical protein
MLKFDQA